MLDFLNAVFSRNPKAEYKVYIYHEPKNNERLAHWEKASNCKSLRRAVRHARALHRKDKYRSIEVKKLFYSNSEKRTISKTIRFYEKAAPSWYGSWRAFFINAQAI